MWQRGTSFSSVASGTYQADRWRTEYDIYGGAVRTVTRQTFTAGQTAVPGNPKYYLQYAQTVAGSGGTYQNEIAQSVESVLTLAGQVATLSMWIQATVGTPPISVTIGQIFGTGGSSTVYINLPTYTLTPNWQQYVWTFQVPSISGKTVGTTGDDYFGIFVRTNSVIVKTLNFASVQLEAGPVATPFEVRPYGVELQLCQRYYQEMPNTNGGHFTGAARLLGATNATSGTNVLSSLYLTIPMRAAPTPTYYGNGSATGNYNINTSSSGSSVGTSVAATSTGTSTTAGNMIAPNLPAITATGGSVQWVDMGWGTNNLGITLNAEL